MPYTENMEDFIRRADNGIQNWQPGNSFFSKVYLLMMAALVLTAASSYIVSEYFAYYIYSNSFVVFGLLILELILVIVLSALSEKLSAPMMFAVFAAYAVINGITLTPVILVYTTASVFKAFLSTALVFGGMTVVGFVVRKDLSVFGRFFMFALIGVLISLLLNLIIFRSGLFDLILSLAIVLIFAGLTAYDTQRIKDIARSSPSSKRAIRCALTLYLDFINIFINLLKIFGQRR